MSRKYFDMSKKYFNMAEKLSFLKRLYRDTDCLKDLNKLAGKDIYQLYHLYTTNEILDDKNDVVLYLYGCIMIQKKQYDKAIKYLQMAMELGNSNSKHKYGVAAYCAGNYMMKIKNYKKTVEYYQIAINHGNSSAMNNLGIYYYDVEQNYKKAIEYYLMAIKLGDSYAMNNLGYYYENIEKNYEKAIEYYLMAVKLGNNAAMNNLGYYYENIEKNYKKAIEYYLMAISHNNFKSRYRIIELFFKDPQYDLEIKIWKVEKTNFKKWNNKFVNFTLDRQKKRKQLIDKLTPILDIPVDLIHLLTIYVIN